jgi:hypothetical protein
MPYLFFIKTILILMLAAVLSACSSISYSSHLTPYYDGTIPQTFWIFAHPPSQSAPSRVIQRNPTFMREASQMLYANLSAFELVPAAQPAQADIRLSLQTEVQTMPGILTPEEIRYRKGVLGSTIPEANPRIRSLQERSLTLIATDRYDEVIWQGKAEHLYPEFYESQRALESVLQELTARLKKDLHL